MPCASVVMVDGCDIPSDAITSDATSYLRNMETRTKLRKGFNDAIKLSCFPNLQPLDVQ